MNEAKRKKIEETKASLERIQTFDVKTLGRADDLGDKLNFDAAVVFQNSTDHYAVPRW